MPHTPLQARSSKAAAAAAAVVVKLLTLLLLLLLHRVRMAAAPEYHKSQH
jgi:hypothetical protein